MDSLKNYYICRLTLLEMKHFPSFIIIVTLCGLSFYSCEDAAEEQNGIENTTQSHSTLFGDSNYKLPSFSEDAETQVAEWLIFEDFENEMRNLNGHSAEILRGKTQRLMVYTDSLTKKIPNQLFTNAVLSRLKVVKTRVHLLSEEVNSPVIDSLRLQTYISELNKAAASLINRINEKILKDDIDVQRKEDEDKELAEQKRYLDSIFLAEKRDREKNNN